MCPGRCPRRLRSCRVRWDAGVAEAIGEEGRRNGAVGAIGWEGIIDPGRSAGDNFRWRAARWDLPVGK